MIQNYTYASRKSPPQKFIPRRDLFPVVELPPPDRTAAGKTTGGSSSYRNQAGNSFYRSSTGKEQTGSQYNKSKQIRPQAKAQPVASGKDQQAQPKVQPVASGKDQQAQARVQPVVSGKAQPNKRRTLPVQQPLVPVKQQSLLPVSPTTLLFLLAGWLLLWPKFKSSQPRLAYSIESTFKNVLDNPQSVQMLRTLGPYLEDNEQDAVYTVAGIMEGVTTFRDVMNHTYHDRYRNMIQHVPLNPAAKKIEAMKAVKPYIPQSSRKQLNQIIGAYDMIEQLNRNIEIYRNNHSLAGDRKVTTIESIAEILNVVRPALPREHREKADKAIQMLKMADAVGTAEKLSRDGNKEKAVSQKKTQDAGQDKEKIKPANSAEETTKSADSEIQVQKVMDSLAPVLNDEQKQSMDMIMKIAQLLVQPAGDAQNPDSEGD